MARVLQFNAAEVSLSERLQKLIRQSRKVVENQLKQGKKDVEAAKKILLAAAKKQGKNIKL